MSLKRAVHWVTSSNIPRNIIAPVLSVIIVSKLIWRESIIPTNCKSQRVTRNEKTTGTPPKDFTFFSFEGWLNGILIKAKVVPRDKPKAIKYPIR